MNKELLYQAINTWGADSQINMIIEESAELIVALHKLRRNHKDLDSKKQALFNVCDEIADVKIMVAQAEIIFNKKLIDERVEFKLKRLEERINTDT